MYRGSTIEFNSCLNLTRPQFVASTKPVVPAQPSQQPRIGPLPAIQAAPNHAPAWGFRPASQR